MEGRWFGESAVGGGREEGGADDPGVVAEVRGHDRGQRPPTGAEQTRFGRAAGGRQEPVLHGGPGAIADQHVRGVEGVDEAGDADPQLEARGREDLGGQGVAGARGAGDGLAVDDAFAFERG